jgi:hypothetical protein
MSLGLQVGSRKIASCDFNARYIPKPPERIAGSKRSGKEATPVKIVETLNKK